MPRSSRLAVLLAVLGVLLLATIFVGDHERRAAAAAESASDPHRTPRTTSTPVGWLAAPAAPALATAGGLRLEGQVVDHRKRPIDGATVTLGDRTVVTEADGAFAFDGLAEGDYSVTAERDGAYAEAIDTTLDATSDPVELELARGPSLRLHVVDEAGAPIAGARVRTANRTATTDAAGRALLRAIEFEYDRITIAAASDAYAEVRLDVDTGDDPSATFEREVVLHPGTRVAGVVLDENGAPVERAIVTLAQVDDEAPDRRELTDEHGAFTFERVGRGLYQLDAHADDVIEGPPVELRVDGVTPVRAVVRTLFGAEVAGVVVDGQGRPVAAADVCVGSRWTRSADDGTFTVRGIEANDELGIGARSPALAARTQVVKIAARAHLRVRIVLEPAALAGVVVDPAGQPVEGASVYARSEDAQGFGVTQSDARGRFDLGGLPPGAYTITATRDDSRHEGPAVVATTGDRGVRLVVPERAELTGTVVLDGAPVRYYGYELLSPDDNQPWSPTPVRDPAGRFSDDDPQPGTWNVAIVGPGFAARIVPGVQITGGRVTDLGTIRVERGRSLRGRVVDMNGAAVAGADIRVRSGYANDGGGGLRAIGRGIFITRTAADGTYHLDGLGPPEDARVLATKDGVGTAEVELGAEDVVDLTLLTVP